MDNTKPTYRPWESKWSPHNRAVIEAQKIKSSERGRKRRQVRADLCAAALESIRTNPDLIAAQRKAQADAGALVAAMAAPKRCQVIQTPRCRVIPLPTR